MAETVHEATGVMTPVAQNKGLELRCEIAAGMPLVLLGDPTRVRQVLSNLVNNAIKFTENGGVTVRAEVDRLDQDEAVLRFAVADTGIGMSAAQREVIFEAFRQADGSTTRRYGGTGLGLSISPAPGGSDGRRLWVESEPGGRGSTFFFTIAARGGPTCRTTFGTTCRTTCRTTCATTFSQLASSFRYIG